MDEDMEVAEEIVAEMEAQKLATAFDCGHTDGGEIPDAMLRLMGFIRDNTGLLGGYTPGTANVHVGGRSMVVYGPDVFDAERGVLEWVQAQEDLRIRRVGIKHTSGTTVPAVTFEVAE